MNPATTVGDLPHGHYDVKTKVKIIGMPNILPGSCLEERTLGSKVQNEVPWSQRLSLNIIIFLFGNLQRKELIKELSQEKRKPLVKIVENLTFMLAQHLTAVRDVIFF